MQTRRRAYNALCKRLKCAVSIHKVEFWSEFRLCQVQYDIYQLYKSLSTEDNHHDKNFKSAAAPNAMRKLKNKFNYLLCLSNLIGMHDTSNDYKCPTNAYNLSIIDQNVRYYQMILRKKAQSHQACDTYMSCMKYYKYSIYRHDVDNCLAYHQCEYSSDGTKLTHSLFALCNGSIFNHYLAKCITPMHAKYYGLRSTIPNNIKRTSCNQMLMAY